MVYGGYDGAVANVNVLWVASDSGVYLRTTAGGALTKTNYAGGPALDIAVDPPIGTRPTSSTTATSTIRPTRGRRGPNHGRLHGRSRPPIAAIRRQRQDRRDPRGGPPGSLRIPGRQPGPGTSWAPTCPTRRLRHGLRSAGQRSGRRHIRPRRLGVAERPLADFRHPHPGFRDAQR